jgi:hypothetical protein
LSSESNIPTQPKRKNGGDFEMLITKKMLMALTLIGALVGAGIGALLTRTATTTSAADTSYNATANSERTQPVSYNAKTPEQMAAENSPQFNTAAEQTAYREGFDAGYAACGTENTNSSRATTTRTSYRAPRRSSNSRGVYYDYGTAPKGRSFWQKHRDKLTLAIGTGAGAGLGALIGGKKGAGIGALAGLGSSALYTYKIRKRNRSY